MKQPKDTQKNKVYASEDVFFASSKDSAGRQFDNVVDAQNWVGAIVAVDPLFDGFPWVYVREAHGNAKASWAVLEDNSISLTPSGMNEQVILHELAHIATGKGFPFHGRQWLWNYLDLTLRWRGPSVYVELRNAFREDGLI